MNRKVLIYVCLIFSVSTTCAVRVNAQEATLQAPAVAWINQSIEVKWTGPNLSGDTLRFVDPSTDKYTPQYVYVGNTKDGIAPIKVPAAVGEYQLVYVSQREVIARVPIKVENISARLVAPARANINSRITVAVEGPNNAGDYIQFVASDGKPIRGLYSYVGNSADGNVPLTVPSEAGEYQISYFTARIPIGSTAITVGAASAELSAPQVVNAGARFQVVWQGPDNPGDRLLLEDLTGNPTGSYTYVGNNPDSATLTAPETPGEFQVVYRTGNLDLGSVKFKVQDVTASLEAADSVPSGHHLLVNWQGPGNASDMIQLVDPRTGDDVAYAYVGNGEDNTVRITVTAEPADYTLHYITGGGRKLASRVLQVTPAAVLPGELQVLAPARLPLTNRDAVEVILDASGSMLQRIDDERRIDIAKRTLTDLLTETIPAGTGFVLRVFGHKEADSCRTDLEVPLTPLDAKAVSSRVAEITAMNLARTPIADSLAKTAQDLKQVTGERIIILLTDGEETCDGTPAEVITWLRDQGAGVRVNIVGFAIDDQALQDTFARWARLGGGAYFNASGEAELSAALSQSVTPAYSVTDSTGQSVAKSFAGPDPLVLPPGDYRVVSGDEAYPVQVISKRRTTLMLD